MLATKAIVGAVALGLVSVAGTAGAAPHPQFVPVSSSGHEVVVRAAEHIQLDRPVMSKKTGGKKCSRTCSDRKRNVPTSN